MEGISFPTSQVHKKKPETFSLAPPTYSIPGILRCDWWGSPDMPWDAACRGSMRTLSQILFSIVFLILILPVIIIPPQVTGSPDEIIPTRNLLIMGNYPDDIKIAPVQSENVMTMSEPAPAISPEPAANISVPVPAGFIAPVAGQAEQPVSSQSEPESFGKGWVQVNLHTSIDSPQQMIEDRQRYMASGLFNVHVYHQYAG